MPWHFKLKIKKSPNSSQILPITHEAAGADPCRARPALSHFPLECTQFLVNSGTRWLARKPWWCWMCGDGPPFPGERLSSSCSCSPRRWLHRRGQLAGLDRSPRPGPQKPEFSDLAMQQINKWMDGAGELSGEAVLPRAKERKSASVGVWLAGFLSE